MKNLIYMCYIYIYYFIPTPVWLHKMEPQRKHAGLTIGNVFMTFKELTGSWWSGHPEKPREGSWWSGHQEKPREESHKEPRKKQREETREESHKEPRKKQREETHEESQEKPRKKQREESPDYLTKICQDYGSPVKARMPLVSGYDTN